MRLKGIFKDKHQASKLGILFLLIFVSFILHIIIAKGLVYLFADNGLVLIQQKDLSNQASVNYLKLMQLFTAVGIFIMPTLLYAYLCNFDLKLRLNFSRQTLRQLLLAIAIMLLINPFISFLSEWNMSFNLPDWLIAYDLKSELLLTSFMRMNSLPDLGFNLLVLAIVPAIGEELLFRGYLQQKFEKWLGKPQLAIIITAILFSAIHLQFQGFLPRFILGLVLGYFMYWSGSLWLPIIAHFCNNAMAVIFVYPALEDYAYLVENKATWQEAFFSFMAVGLLAFLLQKSINIKKG